MEEKKELILKFLKEEKKLSTNKIAMLIKSNHPRAFELLEELRKEGKVNINKELMGISWSLK